MSMGNIRRRIGPGSTRADILNLKVQSMADKEGAFAYQEHIQELISSDKTNLNKICTLPPEQDQHVWVMEHIRQFIQELNMLVVYLDPACNETTCPKMTASKWEFLCATHPQPQECCAIDYIQHTLNGFSATVNNLELFPSRIRVPERSCQQFGSMARRLYRTFAHAYFEHREIFDQFENDTFLCSRFVKFCIMFQLMPKNSFIIPKKDLHLS
eukprot:461731_1